MPKHISPKLIWRWKRPYEIVEVVHPNMYKLDDNNKPYLVLYVPKLKLFVLNWIVYPFAFIIEWLNVITENNMQRSRAYYKVESLK